MNESKVIYRLTDVDFKEETTTFKYKKDGARMFSIIKGVQVSKLLLYRLKEALRDTNKMALEDVDFCSTLMSKSFKENPFKLVKFVKNGELLNYKVELVFEKGFSKIGYLDIFKRRSDKVIHHYWKKENYLRFVEMEVKV